MKSLLPRRPFVRGSYFAVGMSVLLALMFSTPAWAQQQRVSGTVTSAAGGPLPGVTVRVEGTDSRTVTDASGRYSIVAPNDGVLTFALVGQHPVQTTISGRTTVDVTMERVAYLEEVVVTGYNEQRRSDITGAVSSVNIESSQRQTTASVLQRLDANVPGVTVDANGSPGSRSTVRIRGISSFQNNDPLYIVDGTPVQDSYINFLNPNDITSVQVLKDASATSIYGSRASNGVIVIETTKRGIQGPPRATLSVRSGMTSPTRGLDDFLITDALSYYRDIVVPSYRNAGYADADIPTNIFGSVTNPTVPKYIWPNNCNPNPCATVDPTTYDYLGQKMIMPGSAGTDWWKAVFGTGYVGDYNLDVSGGGADNQYGVSFNYFDQKGTAAYNFFRRGSVRVNTSFQRSKLNFGENIAISDDRHTGGQPDDPGGSAEGGILGKNIMMQPVVPIYDIRGNFASGKAVGLGNNTNPLKTAWSARNDLATNDRIFGNVFGGVNPMPELSLLSRFGFNLGETAFNGFSDITPENSEPTTINSINENNNRFTDWTWSNTANYRKTFMQQHNFALLVGQEATQSQNRYITAGMSGLINDAVADRYIQDALGDASTKNVNSSGGRSALLSFFGKADYNYLERYMASFTLRQDGSSNLGPDHRWGTFPAFGLGWRLSKESFFPQNHYVNDMLLRFGWGVTGNQLIPSGRIVSQYGGDKGDTFYDIQGNNTIQPGYRQTSLGNKDLKWEENRSTNVGTDMTLWDGKVSFVADVYTRNTDNLLFDPRLPGTAGVAAPPIVNVGKMQNKGFEFQVGHRGATWSAMLNGSHYNNKIVRIDGVQNFFFGPLGIRFGNPTINEVGQPIGAFYGLVSEGFFNSQAEATARTPAGGCGSAAAPCQDGAAPGRIKFRDVNGDGKITAADNTIIGSPHPKFTGGLDLSYRRGNWDVASTIFGSYGNKIFDAQKQWYVFRNFSTNVRKDLITDSWTPTHTNAKYPILDVNDNYSHAISSFYVEDGSYTRMRALQVGYSIPAGIRYLNNLAGARVYVEAENLFTLTGYDGLDPALPSNNTYGAAGDIRDQIKGVDVGAYPSNRVFSIGIVTSF
jgi:TonB-dependent starch-binding outer membrane protein SusC